MKLKTLQKSTTCLKRANTFSMKRMHSIPHFLKIQKFDVLVNSNYPHKFIYHKNQILINSKKKIIFN